MDENKKTVNYRISILFALGILAFAGFIDFAEIVLDLVGTAIGGVGVVIGLIIDLLKVIVLPAIFIFKKAPFWKGRKAKKKMVSMVTAFVVGLIPWVGAIMPETFIGSMVTIAFTRSEDKGKDPSKIISITDKNITRSRRTRIDASSMSENVVRQSRNIRSQNSSESKRASASIQRQKELNAARIAAGDGVKHMNFQDLKKQNRSRVEEISRNQNQSNS